MSPDAKKAPAPVLEVVALSKEFPGVKALKSVSFAAYPGEVHALCGENGAGKSTLIKTLSGIYPHGAYSGELKVDGRVVAFHRIKDSERAGIAVIHQELSVIKELSVAENVFLGREPSRFGVVRRDELRARTVKLLADVGLKVAPETLVGELGVGQQQLVEIAKALSLDARVLLLDEPTAALTEAETARLLTLLRRLTARGVACVMISHKLDEVFAVASRITVLRDGVSVASYAAASGQPLPGEDRIIADMVGRELGAFTRKPRTPGEVILEVKGLSVKPRAAERPPVVAVDLTLRRGEVLGVAGLMGAGRSELLLALFGAYGRRRRGAIRLAGTPLAPRSPGAAIAAGLALVTEDRKRTGLLLEEPVSFNMVLSSLSRHARFGVVDDGRVRAAAAKYVKDLRVKTASLDTLVRNLSGGNQQKVVLAKCLLIADQGPRVLLLDEPTRGVDVGAKREIYQIIEELADRGMSVIMASSELPELLALSDRILVMNEGRAVTEMSAAEATQESLLKAAVLQPHGDGAAGRRGNPEVGRGDSA